MPEISSNASKTPARSPRIVSIARYIALGTSIALIVLLLLVITKPGEPPKTDSGTDIPIEPANPDEEPDGSEVVDNNTDHDSGGPPIKSLSLSTSSLLLTPGRRISPPILISASWFMT